MFSRKINNKKWKRDKVYQIIIYLYKSIISFRESLTLILVLVSVNR